MRGTQSFLKFDATLTLTEFHSWSIHQLLLHIPPKFISNLLLWFKTFDKNGKQHMILASYFPFSFQKYSNSNPLTSHSACWHNHLQRFLHQQKRKDQPLAPFSFLLIFLSFWAEDLKPSSWQPMDPQSKFLCSLLVASQIAFSFKAYFIEFSWAFQIWYFLRWLKAHVLQQFLRWGISSIWQSKFLPY